MKNADTITTTMASRARTASPLQVYGNWGGVGGGVFLYAGSRGFWWSATEGVADFASTWEMSSASGSVSRGNDGKTRPLSVRCVAD